MAKIFKAKPIKLAMTRKNDGNINKLQPINAKKSSPIVAKRVIETPVVARPTPIMAKKIPNAPVKAQASKILTAKKPVNLGIIHNTDSTLIPQVKAGIPVNLAETSAMFSMNPNSPKSVADTNAAKNAQYATQVISQKLIEATEGEFKEELSTYLEICDSMLGQKWNPDDITDILNILIIALGYDKFALATVEDLNLNSFKYYGFKKSPNDDVFKLWIESLSEEKDSIDWGKFMLAVKESKSDLSEWLYEESINKVGYIPIHDGLKVYGFILVASDNDKKISSIASQLLEICGSRFGLAIALSKAS